MSSRMCCSYRAASGRWSSVTEINTGISSFEIGTAVGLDDSRVVSEESVITKRQRCE